MANALISIKMGVNKPTPVRAEAPTPGICNWAWKYVEVQRRSGKICNSIKDVLENDRATKMEKNRGW
ncbi:MAG: hypothetical protein V8T13_09015 [[Ruminococcus] lactaris]